MKNIGNDDIEVEPGESALRSCWVCNPCHEHLRTRKCGTLFCCLWCGRYWANGVDFSAPECKPDGALTAALVAAGMPVVAAPQPSTAAKETGS